MLYLQYFGHKKAGMYMYDMTVSNNMTLPLGMYNTTFIYIYNMTLPLGMYNMR